MDKWKELLAKLAEMNAKELADARADAVKAFEPYNKKDAADLSDDDLAEMDAIGDFLEGADTRSQEIAAAETDRANRGERAQKPAEAAKAAPKEEAKPKEAAAPKEEPKVEAKPEVKPDGVVVGEVVEEKEPALVAGATKSVAARAASNSTPPVKVEEKEDPALRVSLTAAAGMRDIEAGQHFDSLVAAGPAIWDRLQALPPEGTPGRVEHKALQIRLPQNQLNDVDYRGRESLMFLEASREENLSGKSLVAAGGWGAPSERLLDFCPLETTDGLIQLPEVTLSRPGITYTRGPDFETVLNSNTGFWDMTEAVAEAGTELKTSLRPAVPGFLEARLDAVGVMMECGLLLRAGWPELVDRYAQMALIAHQMKVSAKVLASVRAFTGAAIPMTGVGFGTELDVLHIIELVAVGERQRFAMGENATLEVLLPSWLRAAIRAGLSMRTGQAEYSVTDQQIQAHFTARKLKVQWLNLYQQVDVTTAGVAVKYPDTVDVIMYPAGTYVKGVKPVITLDTIYDSVNLKKNDYVHLFVESGVAVMNPCGTGRRFTIPLNLNGRTGAANVVENFGRQTV